MPKVVDLGAHAFVRFFSLAEEIDFIEEAHRLAIEPVLFFVADPHPSSAQAYAHLIGRFPSLTILPAFNEAVGRVQDYRSRFPIRHGAGLPIVIRRLPPQLKAYALDRRYSFAAFEETLPLDIPLRFAFELRSWTKRSFLEFREFELRLLMEKLRAALAVPDDATLRD
jgi:hypothetical protein